METIIQNLIDKTPLEHWVIVGVLLLLFLTQLHFYFRYYNKIIQYNRKIEKNKVGFTTSQPPVSVIICARNEAENLEMFLPHILSQKYPKYEVIVVNDGSTDQSRELLEKLDKEHPNLYHTFLPMDAKYASRKKMCITVGVKAAKYEHLLFLDADCKPDSDQWLAKMMTNYTPGTEIVLGYSRPVAGNRFLDKLIQFDSLMNALRYMGFALRGDAYRGTGRNMSYKKSLFFDNKGFSHQLKLEAGEDSLFIQSVAKRGNARVEFHSQATTTSYREETKKSYFYQKEAQLQAFKRYKKKVLLYLSAENISRVFFYLFSLAAIGLFIHTASWELLSISVFFVLFRAITQTIVIRKSAALMGVEKFFFSIPIFDFILPLISTYLLTLGQIGKKHP